ncbi:MAG: mechanosensitive ion channel family protein [Bdellovibrionales bacterium]|nr:mechanosensitive ion channel family protein [Bdellovibrionales bacterium]
MNPRPTPWIPLEKIDGLIHLEPALAIAGLAVTAFLIYLVFLRNVSEDRHRNIKRLFINLLGYLVLATTLFLTYLAIRRLGGEDTDTAPRIAGYVGFATIVMGAVVFVRTARILVFEYLFIGSMKTGVPVLLVNISSLLLSILIGGWILSDVFSIRLAPLLATSAIFSLILGLALQDTLGNLFAGIALQLDKPYEIGHWIEVSQGTTKWVGRVEEISWRATVLVGLSDEILSIPNRMVAQGEVTNYSVGANPPLRALTFRIPHGANDSKVRDALIQSCQAAPGVLQDPKPFVLLSDTHESWLPYKLIYAVEDFGRQTVIANSILQDAIQKLEKNGIPLAGPRLDITKTT